MRLYRYVAGGGGVQPRLAAAVGDGDPVDLLDGWGAFDDDHALALSSMRRFIEAGPEVWARAADVARSGRPVEGARWLCPFDEVPSLRDFLAFEDHVKLGAARRDTDVPDYWYEAPVYYKGNHRALLGPDDDCPWPDYTEWLDFELELAMVVGMPGSNLTPPDAARHIFGFTAFNDWSARDIQAREISAWLGPGKGKDFANSFGPCIVTVDEVGAEPDLKMICRVNGEEWGRGRSSDMHWSWADMIAHVARAERIYPGDVYGSGTPGGCCGLDLGRKLRPGDIVALEIEKIGTLRNRVSSPSGQKHADRA